MSNDALSTKIVTGLVRFSYAQIWEPRAMEEGGDKKYSLSAIIPKSDKATISKIRKVLDQLTEEAKKKYNGKLPKGFKLPLRDGDEDRAEDEAYADSMFVNCTSKNQPGIVNAKREKVMEQDEVYSGCYGHVSINFYLYDKAGSKGIAAGLNNVMKVKDGEPLSGRASAEEDFKDLEVVNAQEDEDDLL